MTTASRPSTGLAGGRRAVPLPFTTAVSGVSFRQAEVACCYVGERLTCRWVPHPRDEWACEVRGEDARLLGYVPAGLAPRVVATVGDGVLDGEVVAVLGEHTLGLRVRFHRSTG